MPTIDTPIDVLQLKPGAKPHMSWQAVRIAEDKEWLAILAEPGITVRHHTRNLTYTLPHYCISLFSRKEYFNVMLDFHSNGNFKQAYINVAEPATWENDTVQALDLDLDVIVSPEGLSTLLDEDEFAESIAAGKYSEQTIAIARQTTEQLMRISGQASFPFLRGNLEEVIAAVKQQLDTAKPSA